MYDLGLSIIRQENSTYFNALLVAYDSFWSLYIYSSRPKPPACAYLGLGTRLSGWASIQIRKMLPNISSAMNFHTWLKQYFLTTVHDSVSLPLHGGSYNWRIV